MSYVYVCAECGAWLEVRLAQALTDAINEAAKELDEPYKPVQTNGYPCQYGHGLMQRLRATDRIFVRPAGQ